jgi:hypothetical protein
VSLVLLWVLRPKAGMPADQQQTLQLTSAMHSVSPSLVSAYMRRPAGKR